jgi:hypothetical protein
MMLCDFDYFHLHPTAVQVGIITVSHFLKTCSLVALPKLLYMISSTSMREYKLGHSQGEKQTCIFILRS